MGVGSFGKLHYFLTKDAIEYMLVSPGSTADSSHRGSLFFLACAEKASESCTIADDITP